MSQNNTTKRNIKKAANSLSDNTTATEENYPKDIDTGMGIESPEVNLNDYRLTYSNQNYNVYSEMENVAYENISKRALKNVQKEVNQNLGFNDRNELMFTDVISLLLSIPLAIGGGITLWDSIHGKPSTISKLFSKPVNENDNPTLEEIKMKYGLPEIGIDPKNGNNVNGPFQMTGDKIGDLLTKIVFGAFFLTGLITSVRSGYHLYQHINNKDYGMRHCKSFKNSPDISYQIAKPRYILDKKSNQIITIETNNNYQDRLKQLVK